MMLNSRRVSLILFVLFFSASVFFTMLHNWLNSSMKENLIEEEKIGVKGLPYGIELSNTLLLEDDLYFYYEDMIVEKYVNDSIRNNESILRINSFFNAMPESVNKVISLTPMVIAYEDVIGDESSIAALTQIKEGLNSNIKWIDIHPVYESKKDEYLFFRTDPRITSLAAYYIAKEFLSTKGITINPLENYHEDRRAKITGIYMLLPN